MGIWPTARETTCRWWSAGSPSTSGRGRRRAGPTAGACGAISTVSASLNNYYEDGAGFNDTFGYFDVGAVGSFPLGLPESVGSWELTGGVHLLALGNYLEAINDGDQFQVVGSFGFSIGY